jgi:hypothetical protein
LTFLNGIFWNFFTILIIRGQKWIITLSSLKFFPIHYFVGRSGAGAAANDFFELGNDDDDLGELGECLEAPGSETLNGGQDEVMQQIEEEMAAMRTSTASPPQPPPPGSNFIYFVHGSQFGYCTN